MSTTGPRKSAPRLAKPVTRYWRGKAPKGVTDVASDSDSDQEVQEEGGEDILVKEDGDDGVPGLEIQGAPRSQLKQMNIALKDVDIKDGKVIVAGREESGKTVMEESEEESEEEEEEEEEEETKVAQPGEETESSEEEESESEEEPQAPMFRPMFVPKRGRVTVLEREQEAQDTEEALERKRIQEEERKKQSHDMVAESIRRELLEKEKEEEQPDIDDTDGVNPDEEFEAWRLRELARIKRDKEVQLRREEEREEIERRRALPEEQRLKEDMEHANKTREEKPKTKQKFLQKYWHKGAFHQDDEVMKKHDYNEATESAIDVTLLPKVMQVRDFGKRSRTKYTHLLDQDTTVGNGGFGGATPKPGAKPFEQGQGCFNCGGPHLKKDCPRLVDGPPGTGANAANSASSSKHWKVREEPQSHGSDSRRWHDKGDEKDGNTFRAPRDKFERRDSSRDRNGRDDYYPRDRDRIRRRDNRERYGERDRDRNYSRYSRRSRSRSRSPRRDDRSSYRPKAERRHSRDRSPGERRDDDRRREKRIRTD